MKHAAQDIWGISKVCGPQSHRCSTDINILDMSRYNLQLMKTTVRMLLYIVVPMPQREVP